MIHFTLKKQSRMNRDMLYSISTDIENFSNIMPKHFKYLKIKKRLRNEIFVDEKIYFSDVKVKHVISSPDIHEVHILSGMLSGTSFIEHYVETTNGTDITIDVSIKLNGVTKLFIPFGFFLKWHMSKVMQEFLRSSEKCISEGNRKNG